MNEEDDVEDNVIVPDKLSGPLLAKVDIKFFSFVKKMILKNNYSLYIFRYDKT